MTDHRTTLVPIEAWTYSSIDVADMGKRVDMGLLMEALLYYDHAAFAVSNLEQFRAVLGWFIERGLWEDLLRLFRDGSLSVYEYGFLSPAVRKDGTYLILNFQDEKQAEANSFPDRFLSHQALKPVIPGVRKQRQLRHAIAEQVIEAKAEDFGPAVEEARRDHEDPDRNSLIIQALVDDLFRLRGLGTPPVIRAAVAPSVEGHTISWGIDFGEIERIAGSRLRFHPGSPITAGSVANRLLRSASLIQSDLFLASPMSRLVGDKLYEASSRIGRPQEIIQNLKAEVQFPDVRTMVNEDRLSLERYLELRRRAKRFRHWLQGEAERDRDALIAYHHEVARASGFARSGKRALQLFGLVGTGVLGSGLIADPLVGSGVGTGVVLTQHLAERMAKEWRPVVFGRWLEARIRELDGSPGG